MPPVPPIPVGDAVQGVGTLSQVMEEEVNGSTSPGLSSCMSPREDASSSFSWVENVDNEHAAAEGQRQPK